MRRSLAGPAVAWTTLWAGLVACALAVQGGAAQPPAGAAAGARPPALAAASRGGVRFTVPQIDDLADFHGDLGHIKLALYVGGNDYFYVTNTLTIMVARGNPAHIGGLADLANPALKLAMPDPQLEGIARQIRQALQKAGVTWQSEALYQEQAGHPISHVSIPAAYNATGVYGAAVVRGAAHAQAARAWLHFLRSPAALAIFEHYGFRPYESAP